MLRNRYFIFIMLSLIYYGCTPSKVNSELFNDGWEYMMLSQPDSLSGMAVQPEKGFEGKEKVRLPHTARVEPMVVNDQWQGVCYYQKKFSLPDISKHHFLKFDAAMNEADVWMNGKHVYHHLGGYLPFVVDITDCAEKENLLVVRLDNRDNAVTGPKPLHQLDYCLYGGLYRNVWLLTRGNIYVSEPLEIDSIGGGGIAVTTEKLNTEYAEVGIRANIMNKHKNSAEIKVTFTITDPKGKEVAKVNVPSVCDGEGSRNVEGKVRIKAPMLWTPETPDLYKLHTEVFCDGELQDTKLTRFGIRDLKIVDNKLYINGEERYLLGVNRHQEYPYIGNALSDAAQYRDAYKIKNAGFDYIRLSHYPQSEAFLDACDELGLLVLDAISGWQYYGESEDFDQFTLQASREMIRRDRNHPCILAWEVSLNETHMPSGLMQQLNAAAKEETPRMYTAGWVRDGGYDIYIESRQYRLIYPDIDRDCSFIVSEYGDWEYACLNAGMHQDEFSDLLPAERNSRQPRWIGEKRLVQQALNIQESHNSNKCLTGAFADGYWVMFDYNRGYANDLEYSGIMDIFRLPKLAYYFFQSQRSYSPGNKFAPYRLKIAALTMPEKRERIKVFSNCEEVELFIDGKSVGRKSPDRNEITTKVVHPPFTFQVPVCQAKHLKAVGYANGQQVMEDEVRVAGKPAKIVIRADVTDVPVQYGVNDGIFVYASVTDKDGVEVYDYKGKIKFEIQGDGVLLPSEEVEVEGGIATALIQIGKEKNVVITASSDGLEQAVLHL